MESSEVSWPTAPGRLVKRLPGGVIPPLRAGSEPLAFHSEPFAFHSEPVRCHSDTERSPAPSGAGRSEAARQDDIFHQPARDALRGYFEKLLRALGPQGWWPARTRLEVIVGAILVQNTAWQNAALALKKLKQNGLLTLAELKHASLSELASCVRSAGFYRRKDRTIRNFLTWLEGACDGSLTVMFALPAAELRRRLLEVKGLGPETADAILLYAGRHPVFVADSYTRRILARHGMVPPRAGYAQVQEFLHRYLPADQTLFNEYHALLVEVGKKYCKRQVALCGECPLAEFLPQDEARQYLARGETPRLTASTAARDTGETVSAGCAPR